jgi:hypothetical protein
MNTHRVRFFSIGLNAEKTYTMPKVEKFNMVVNEFKQQPQYLWVEENDVKLNWMEDDDTMAWYKQIIIYGDLTESQYVDYALRFFKHGKEWK